MDMEIRINEIFPSATNRTHFSESALNELALSIKEKGLMQPILVRPIAPVGQLLKSFEIVAGERRWRAAKMAGLKEIKCVVRELSDKEAQELQIIENLQRENLHPLEEAQAFQLYMMKHGANVADVSRIFKKSKEYVYASLKLCDLNVDLHTEFLNGDIDASTALLIARIPNPGLQKRALQEVKGMSFRASKEHIQQRFQLNLAKASFDIADAKLTEAGSCKRCPKRTGNMPDAEKGTSKDLCTDPDCYAEKSAANLRKVTEQKIKEMEKQQANTPAPAAGLADEKSVTIGGATLTATSKDAYAERLAQVDSLLKPAEPAAPAAPADDKTKQRNARNEKLFNILRKKLIGSDLLFDVIFSALHLGHRPYMHLPEFVKPHWPELDIMNINSLKPTEKSRLCADYCLAVHFPQPHHSYTTGDAVDHPLITKLINELQIDLTEPEPAAPAAPVKKTLSLKK